MATLLLFISALGAVYAIVQIIYKMIKGRRVKQVLSSTDFKIFIVSAIVTICILFPWSKIHLSYGDNNPTPTKLTIIDTPKIVIEPIQPMQSEPTAKDNKSNNNSTPKIETIKAAPVTPQPQFDLKGATIDRSAIGINPKVEIYDGIKQRTLSEVDLSRIIQNLENKDMVIALHFYGEDKETITYVNQIIQELNSRGYKNIYKNPHGSAHNSIFDKIDISKRNDAVYIRVYPSSNVK